MGKLNRAAIISVVFCLSISLLFSGCKIDQSEVSSEETSGTESSETSSSNTERTENTSPSEIINEINYPYDLSVQIIGTDRDGDCTILRYKDTEILIDTTEGDASIEAVRKVIKDKKKSGDTTWDYVIFTHPDNDHISKASAILKIFNDEKWTVENIIDFGETNKNLAALTDYIAARNELKCKYFTPNGTLSTNRLTEEFVIDSRFKLTVLYNQANDAGSANDQSVCCLFTIGEQKLLFTGDLGSDGEEALIDNHGELLKNVTFFKAGHHGSHSSNSQEFIDWIRPAYVAITYNHQITEDALAKNISVFLKYTDYIYPTYVNNVNNNSYYLFGDCTFEFNGKYGRTLSQYNQNRTIREAGLNGSSNSWYWYLVGEGKITDEINTYFFDENTHYYTDNNRPGYLSHFNCTLVKYGHYDILIDCGSIDYDSKVFVEKLKDYAVDGIIECVVVSHFHLSNYSQLIGESISDDECVFKQFKIEKVIDNDVSMTNNTYTTGTSYSVYLSKVLSASERTSLKDDDSTKLDFCYGLKLYVYRGNNNRQQDNEDDYSLVTVIDFNGYNMVFVGDLTNYSWFNDNYGKYLKNVCLVRFPSTYVEYKKMNGFDSFLSMSRPDVIVIGSPVNHWNNGQTFISNRSIKELVTFLENNCGKRNLKIYSPGYIENEKNVSCNGDLAFTLYKSHNNTEYKYYVSCHYNGENTNSLYSIYYANNPVDMRKFFV